MWLLLGVRVCGGTARVDFSHTIVVMTSNLAADVVRGARGELGFVPSSGTGAGGGEDRAIDEALNSFLRPELINRIDQIVPFAQLGPPELESIAGFQLRALEARLADRGIHIEPTPDAIRWLAERGYDPRYGARPLRRLIQERVTDPVVDLILADETGLGTIRIDARDGDLCLTVAGPE